MVREKGTLKLQWGHDFSAVEMVSVGRLTSTPTGSFNGATTFQPWKCLRLDIYLALNPASMGPRLFSRGNGI